MMMTLYDEVAKNVIGEVDNAHGGVTLCVADMSAITLHAVVAKLHVIVALMSL